MYPLLILLYAHPREKLSIMDAPFMLYQEILNETGSGLCKLSDKVHCWESRQVLKMRIWGVPPAGGPLLYLHTTQAGRGNSPNSYLQNLANDGTPNSVCFKKFNRNCEANQTTRFQFWSNVFCDKRALHCPLTPFILGGILLTTMDTL